MKNYGNNKNKDYDDGLINGVISCKEEERKLSHGDEPKSKNRINEIFNFPNLN